MSLRADTTQLVSPGLTASLYAGLGITGAAVPATGTHGPAAAYDFLTLPAQNAVEVQWLMQTYPSAGAFNMGEDTGFSLPPGAPDGTYTFTGILKFDGVSQGLKTHTITIGAVSGGTGSLAATESGPDTAALAGYKSAFGAVNATESGPDTAELFGGEAKTGAIDATEAGPDTAVLVAAGAPVFGAVAAVEAGPDTAVLIAQFPFSTSASPRRMTAESARVRVLVSPD